MEHGTRIISEFFYFRYWHRRSCIHIAFPLHIYGNIFWTISTSTISSLQITYLSLSYELSESLHPLLLFAAIRSCSNATRQTPIMNNYGESDPSFYLSSFLSSRNITFLTRTHRYRTALFIQFPPFFQSPSSLLFSSLTSFTHGRHMYLLFLPRRLV